VLNEKENIVLSPSRFPVLNRYKGQKIITTDGNTLLGADDKAGIAEIMTALEFLINHPEILHGKIRIAFTPDEEIGRGADRFNVEKFGAGKGTECSSGLCQG
jgi:tripeptide aminopeptidase